MMLSKELWKILKAIRTTPTKPYNSTHKLKLQTFRLIQIYIELAANFGKGLNNKNQKTIIFQSTD